MMNLKLIVLLLLGTVVTTHGDDCRNGVGRSETVFGASQALSKNFPRHQRISFAPKLEQGIPGRPWWGAGFTSLTAC